MTTTSQLQEEFEQLRLNARSLKELSDWFTAHPDVIVGNLPLTTDSKCNVSLSYDGLFVLKNFADTGCLSVFVQLTVDTPFVVHPLLTNASATDISPYKHSYKLALSTLEWPLAAAICTVDYLTDIRSQHPAPAGTFLATVEERIRAALDLHFEGVTLEGLRTLVYGDLVVRDKHGRVDESYLINQLFAAKKSVAPVSMPLDLL